MVTRVGGNRRKTRYKFKKGHRQKGKLSLTRYFQTFEEGQKVKLLSEPSVHSGMYHRRVHGKVGVVQKRQGRCYYVAVKDHNKTKQFIVHPVHLKAL
ncbi:50S ribosomal protein L21e [Candidatus Woesearchaeota archaeon]|nr:MAG: 50S ribosomal protein L21e [Candidatus Woesearchaeota archaeon]